MVSQATKLAVKAEAVVKNFGETAVLRGLNLELPTGEVTVLLGTMALVNRRFFAS